MMVSYNKLKLLILFLGVIQIAPSQGSWFNWCSTIVGITCRTTIPALGGACIPASSWLCGRRRRRALSDSSMIYVFPQNFNDYESEDGKIAMDKFITGIQEALPEHLRRYAAIAEVFDAADVNDDGFLDAEEFSKGPWIAPGGDVEALKRELSQRNENPALKRELSQRNENPALTR